MTCGLTHTCDDFTSTKWLHLINSFNRGTSWEWEKRGRGGGVISLQDTHVLMCSYVHRYLKYMFWIHIEKNIWNCKTGGRPILAKYHENRCIVTSLYYIKVYELLLWLKQCSSEKRCFVIENWTSASWSYLDSRTKSKFSHCRHWL